MCRLTLKFAQVYKIKPIIKQPWQHGMKSQEIITQWTQIVFVVIQSLRSEINNRHTCMDIRHNIGNISRQVLIACYHCGLCAPECY